MFKRNVPLSKVSLGDLKMLDAQLDCQIQLLMQKANDADAKITRALAGSKDTKDAYQHAATAREITGIITRRRDMFQRLEILETKKQALARIISAKEAESPLFSSKTDILDSLDLESLEKMMAGAAVETEVARRRAQEMLKRVDAAEDYENVLEVVRSASLDGEGIAFAKAEIDEITAKQTV